MKIPDWLSEAACRGMDPGLFVPDVTVGKAFDYSVPLAICSGCPVAAECLEHFIDERHGVFGGTTPRQRWEMTNPRPEPTGECAGCGVEVEPWRRWCAAVECRAQRHREANHTWKARRRAG